MKGVPGGFAALDSDGDVVDADGVKILGGSGGGDDTVDTLGGTGVNGRLLMAGSTASANLGNLGFTTYAKGLAGLANQAALQSMVGVGPTAYDPIIQDFLDSMTTADARTAIGLGNVNNTSDANKPVSTLQAASIATKANTTHAHALSDITSGISTYARSLLDDVDASTYLDSLGGSATGKAIFAGDPTAGRTALSVNSSSETAVLLTTKLDITSIGLANGVAGLASDGLLPASQLTGDVQPTLVAIAGSYPSRPSSRKVEWVGPTVPPDLQSGDKWLRTA
jgi:hypothetical protein